MNWLVMAAVIIALAALAGIAFLFVRCDSASKNTDTTEASAPNAENDKVIMVSGWKEEELRKIIDDFIEMYKRDSYPAYTINLEKRGDYIHRFTFPRDIHPLLFTFLINYLAYPSAFDLTTRSILVGGTSTLTSAFEGIDSSLFGQKAILYIPENDQDHAVVYLQTERGLNLANSFTELVWRRVKTARLSIDVKSLVDTL